VVTRVSKPVVFLLSAIAIEAIEGAAERRLESISATSLS
jgi:hypothetical protein